MRYDHFSMLPERAFQPRNGRSGGMTLEGGGGGGPSQTTTYTSNIPEWLKPQTEALLGAATQEYFNVDSSGNITSVKPYVPYSTRPQDYIAGFSPLQQQSQYEIAGMQRPGQYGAATSLAGTAGMGGLGSAQQALGYGGLGTGYGSMAAHLAPEAQRYGELGSDIGMYGTGAGQRYEQMATNPYAMQAYMSPYVANVIEQQKEGAIRDAQKAQLAQNLGAAKQGTYGGARQLLATTERERALGSQLSNIEATGLQKAYEAAQQAQQFGSNLGLQGLQTGLSGQQLGIQGLGQAGQLYGLGMQGAGLGLQGVQGAQAGYGLAGQQAGLLGQLGTQQQASDLARIQAQAELGASQQAMEQAYINQAVQNYALAQQYPYQQLAAYSGLLRGYSTPTTSVSQYSAAPSFTSQAAGLGTAALGLSSFMKKEGGAIKEQGIDDLIIAKRLKKDSK